MNFRPVCILKCVFKDILDLKKIQSFKNSWHNLLIDVFMPRDSLIRAKRVVVKCTVPSIATGIFIRISLR